MTSASGELGIEPVPASGRVLSLWETFVLWGDLGISFLVTVVGIFLVPGLGLGEALTAILVGAIIGNALLGVGALIGNAAGVPTMVVLRAPLGKAGSYLPTVLNIVQLLGWTTLEVIIMAQATDLLLTRFLGLPSLYGVWVAVFVALTLVMTLSGPIAVIKKWLARYALWAVLLSLVWITVAVFQSYDVLGALAKPGTGEMSFWFGVDLVVALPISWFPLVADYSRFARTKQAAFWGTSLGYFVPQVWLYALGALLALSAGVIVDPNAPINPLLAAIAGVTAGWLALLFLIVGETDEGFANLYSTAVSVQNLFPQLPQRWIVLAGGAIALIVGLTFPLTQYESFLLLIGTFFVPLLGVLAADYFLVRGQHYSGRSLVQAGQSGPFTGGVHWPGLVVWLLGAGVYVAISGIPVFGIAGNAPWLGASLPSFVFAFVVYALVGRLFLADTGHADQAGHRGDPSMGVGTHPH